MASMIHKAGTALQTGATASPISGTIAQSSTRSATGDLVILRDATGADISAYVTDPHEELTFEAVIESNTPDKEIGDLVSVDSKKYLVTQWQVTESNEDVKRVSIGLRSTTLSAATT